MQATANCKSRVISGGRCLYDEAPVWYDYTMLSLEEERALSSKRPSIHALQLLKEVYEPHLHLGMDQRLVHPATRQKYAYGFLTYQEIHTKFDLSQLRAISHDNIDKMIGICISEGQNVMYFTCILCERARLTDAMPTLVQMDVDIQKSLSMDLLRVLMFALCYLL